MTGHQNGWESKSLGIKMTGHQKTGNQNDWKSK